MKKILIAIALLASSSASATGTNPPPQTIVVDPSATANQQQGQVGIVKGGDNNATSSPTVITTAQGGNPTSEVSNIRPEAKAVVGDAVLTSGDTNLGGVSSEQRQVQQANATAKQEQAIKDSANNSFNYQSYDQNIHRAGLVQNDCNRRSVDAAGGKENRFLGIAWTTQDHDCRAIKHAEAVVTMFGDREWAKEILCGRDDFLEADARKLHPLCHDNGGSVAVLETPKAETVSQR